MHQLRRDQRLQLSGASGRRLKRQSEDFAVDAVRRAIEAEGHTTSEWWRPDEADRSARAPDAAFLLDGKPAAIEVVAFRISQHDSDANAVASRLVEELSDAVPIRAGDPNGTVLPIVLYDPVKLLELRPAVARADVRGLGQRMRSALDQAVDPWQRHEIYPRPSWVKSASVVRVPGDSTETLAYLDGLGHNIGQVVSDFVLWVVERKGSQHEGYGKGILAIQQRWLEDQANLSEAFDALDSPAPWWRVYLVERDGRARLVCNRFL